MEISSLFQKFPRSCIKCWKLSSSFHFVVQQSRWFLKEHLLHCSVPIISYLKLSDFGSFPLSMFIFKWRQSWITYILRNWSTIPVKWVGALIKLCPKPTWWLLTKSKDKIIISIMLYIFTHHSGRPVLFRICQVQGCSRQKRPTSILRRESLLNKLLESANKESLRKVPAGDFFRKVSAKIFIEKITCFIMLIRARWIKQHVFFVCGHTHSYVKLNFRVGLFSCIFLFEVIFCCFLGILYLPFFTREKRPK